MVARPDDPVLDVSRARTLVEAACPELRPAEVAHLGRGWDNDVYLVNDRWVFRFPRNAPAATALLLERDVLPALATRLPVQIPVPSKGGLLDDDSGWPFAGYPFLPGRTVYDAGLDASARARLAPAVAGFLRALHAIPLDRLPKPLPPDPLGRFDVSRRGPVTRERLLGLRRDGLLPAGVVHRLLAVWDDPPDAPPGEPLVAVHADMHPRNLLVDEGGALSGVIDWVDLHQGHRAVDLIAAFEVVPSEARDVFFAHYGPVSEQTLRWARWRAINHAVAALIGALERGDAVFARGVRESLLEIAR